MVDYRTRNQIILIEPEAVSGTEETPTAAANALRMENANWQPDANVIQTAEHTGSLDGAGPIVGRVRAGFTGDVLMKGAGSAGAAPEFGPCLRAAGLAQTLTATDVTGTAQAGSSSSITLAAGASAVTDIHKGMVLTIDGGTGSGQAPVVVSAYNGTTKVATVVPDFATTPDATSTYNILANALYIPASASLETATVFRYLRSHSGANAHLSKLVGAVSGLTFAMPIGEVGRWGFSFLGLVPSAPANVSDPGDPTLGSVRPPPLKNMDAYLGGSAVKFNSASLDLGNQIGMGDDPAAAEGYDVGFIAGRTITGSINPVLGLLSARNNYADFTAGTERSLWLRWGTTAGNRVSVFCPALRYTGAAPGDTDGASSEDLAFEATGEDAGVYLSLY